MDGQELETIANIEVRGFRHRGLMKILTRIAWGLCGLAIAVHFIPNLAIRVVFKLVFLLFAIGLMAYGFYRQYSFKAIPESDRDE